MRKKGIFLLLIMLVLLTINVYANIITDDFDDNLLDSSIWTQINDTSQGATVFNESGGRMSFKGYNGTDSLLESNAQIISGEHGELKTDYVITNISGTNNRPVLYLSDGISGSYCGIAFKFKATETYITHNYPTSTRLTTLSAPDTDTHEYRIVVTREATTTDYEIYIDGVKVATDSQGSACSDPDLNFSVNIEISDTSYLEMYLDDFNLEYAEALNGTNAGCENNEDCDSGKCQGGFCVLKSDGETCDSNDQCISGTCTNGKCAKTQLFDKLDYWKDEAYGDDSDTNNLISIFLTIFITALVVSGTARLGSGVFAGVIGGLVFITLMIFFTIVGWLSPFILLGVFFICLIALVFIVLLTTGGTN